MSLETYVGYYRYPTSSRRVGLAINDVTTQESVRLDWETAKLWKGIPCVCMAVGV